MAGEQGSVFEGARGGDWVCEGDGEEDDFRGALNCLENTARKPDHVKQSIDHALNSVKAYCPAPTAEPASPLGEYPFCPPLSFLTRYQRRP